MFALSLSRPLSFRFVGEGRLRLQVVAEGHVAWDAPGFGRARAGSQLELSVRRPTEGRVGVAQTWRIELRNRGRQVLASPMAELHLPPGFELARDTSGQPQGGLRQLLTPPAAAPGEAPGAQRDPPLRFYELSGRLLVLYARDLAPGEKLTLPVRFVPTLVGSYAGGALAAYPYYAASDGRLLRAPGRFLIRPAIVGEAPRRLAPTARAAATPEATPAPQASAAPTPSPVAAAPPDALVIGWDTETLGPLDVSQLDLLRGDGPLERLVGRALAASPTGVVFDGAGPASKRLQMPRQSWSNEFPVTGEDFVAAQRAACAALQRGEARLYDPRRWSVLSAQLRILGHELLEFPANLCSGDYEREPLAGAPLFAEPPRASERGETSGAFVLQPAREGAVLVKERWGGRVVRIEPVRDAWKARKRCDLIWRATRAEEAEAAYRVALFGRTNKASGSQQVSLRGLCPPLLRGFGLRERRRQEERPSSSFRVPSRLTLLVGQAALREVAEELRRRCEEAGVSVEIRHPYDLPPLSEDTLLLVAYCPQSAFASRERRERAALGIYARNVTPGRKDPGRAVDPSGWLRWPLNLRSPPSKPEAREAWEKRRKRLLR